VLLKMVKAPRGHQRLMLFDPIGLKLLARAVEGFANACRLVGKLARKRLARCAHLSALLRNSDLKKLRSSDLVPVPDATRPKDLFG
jgi:hypothetical protein